MSGELTMPELPAEFDPLIAGESLTLSSGKKIFTCVRCGSLMQEYHCKVLCGNCGYLMDCSDLF